MKDAERTAFAQGVNDGIQLREEADMRETRSALELAFDNISFLIASPYTEAARRQQVCFYSKRAVRGAARALQMTVLRDLEGFDDDSFGVQKNEALKLVRSFRF